MIKIHVHRNLNGLFKELYADPKGSEYRKEKAKKLRAKRRTDKFNKKFKDLLNE